MTTPMTLIGNEFLGSDKKSKFPDVVEQKKKKFCTLLLSQTASHSSLQEQWNELYITYYKSIETGDITMQVIQLEILYMILFLPAVAVKWVALQFDRGERRNR